MKSMLNKISKPIESNLEKFDSHFTRKWSIWGAKVRVNFRDKNGSFCQYLPMMLVQ